MFWNEDKDETVEYEVPDDIVDLSFKLIGRNLPLDHAHALSQEIQAVLPWITEEDDAGIHLIHVAESGNGWFRPEDVENEVLHLSRRTRMSLRLPKHRLEDAEALLSATLNIAGHELQFREPKVKPFSTVSSQFSRYIMTDPNHSEEEFLQAVADQIEALGIKVKKLMAGKSNAFQTPEGPVHTRSAMIADLDPEQAVLLQQKGIGEGRKMGFGLFIPHKGLGQTK